MLSDSNPNPIFVSIRLQYSPSQLFSSTFTAGSANPIDISIAGILKCRLGPLGVVPLQCVQLVLVVVDVDECSHVLVDWRWVRPLVALCALLASWRFALIWFQVLWSRYHGVGDGHIVEDVIIVRTLGSGDNSVRGSADLLDLIQAALVSIWFACLFIPIAWLVENTILLCAIGSLRLLFQLFLGPLIAGGKNLLRSQGGILWFHCVRCLDLVREAEHFLWSSFKYPLCLS